MDNKLLKTLKETSKQNKIEENKKDIKKAYDILYSAMIECITKNIDAIDALLAMSFVLGDFLAVGEETVDDLPLKMMVETSIEISRIKTKNEMKNL